MGKKRSSRSSPSKTPKHEKKPQLNNLMKILRPKVYITDACNFKSLVQELTGNGKYQPPPPATSVPLSPLTWEVPFVETYQDFHHHNLVYQETMSCSSVAASVEASPELSLTAAPSALNREMEIYKGLEAMLMEMDSDLYDYDACYSHEMFQQDHQHQLCAYDYDLSNFV